MRREIYYRKSKAQEAAERFADEHNGFISGSDGLDDRSKFDFEDDEMPCWSGSVAAIVVRNLDTYEEIGRFGYWNEEL